jgi:hypothetical protein
VVPRPLDDNGNAVDLAFGALDLLGNRFRCAKLPKSVSPAVAFAPDLPLQILPAVLLETGAEFIEVPHLRHKNKNS